MPIYVHRNNQRLGPYTVAEVKTQLASGALSIHDHVWWQGQQDWVPLGKSALMESGFQEIPGPAKSGPKPLTGTSSFAIATLIAGCISLGVWIFTSLFAIVLGHFALNEIKKNPGLKGRGMAIAGLAMGYIMTLLSVAALVSYIMYMPEIERVAEIEQARKDASPPALPAGSAARTPSPSTTATNSALAGTNGVPNQSAPPPATTNSAPASTNSPDSSTNSPAPSTNAPDSSTTTPRR